MLVVKNLPANTEDLRDAGLIPGLGRSPGEGNGSILAWKDPMDRRSMERRSHGRSPSVFLLGKSHGQKTLVGYSPWDLKEWDMIEAT